MSRHHRSEAAETDAGDGAAEGGPGAQPDKPSTEGTTVGSSESNLQPPAPGVPVSDAEYRRMKSASIKSEPTASDQDVDAQVDKEQPEQETPDGGE